LYFPHPGISSVVTEDNAHSYLASKDGRSAENAQRNGCIIPVNQIIAECNGYPKPVHLKIRLKSGCAWHYFGKPSHVKYTWLQVKPLTELCRDAYLEPRLCLRIAIRNRRNIRNIDAAMNLDILCRQIDRTDQYKQYNRKYSNHNSP